MEKEIEFAINKLNKKLKPGNEIVKEHFVRLMYEANFRKLVNLLGEFEKFWKQLLELIEDNEERLEFKNKAEGYLLHIFENNILAPFRLELDLLMQGKIKVEDTAYFMIDKQKNLILNEIACQNRIENGSKLAFLQLDFTQQLVSGKKVKIKNLEREKNLLHEKIESFQLNNHEYLKRELENANRELENSHLIISKYRSKTKTLESGINSNKLYELIGSKKCRKKNGDINYSKLGKELGVSNHTAKKKCSEFQIS